MRAPELLTSFAFTDTAFDDCREIRTSTGPGEAVLAEAMVKRYCGLSIKDGKVWFPPAPRPLQDDSIYNSRENGMSNRNDGRTGYTHL
jgi:hypothetical protein